jgi:uncharacterized membrane protein
MEVETIVAIVASVAASVADIAASDLGFAYQN